MLLHCTVCGGQFSRSSQYGPTPKRCPSCKSVDKRVNYADRQEATKQWREKHLAQEREKQQARYWADPIKARKYAAEYREKLGRKFLSDRQRGYNYGLSPGEFELLVKSQGSVCAICGADSPGGRGGWHLDHDHRFAKTDKNGHRGVLCHACNIGLGNFKDDESLMLKAIDYLRRSKFKIKAV